MPYQVAPVGDLFSKAPWAHPPQGERSPNTKFKWTCCCWWSDEIPAWMAVPFCSRLTSLTPATLLWILNFIAFLFHLTYCIAIIILSVGLDNWKTYGGVLLPLYKTSISFARACAADGEAAAQWELMPTYVVSDDNLNLTWLTIGFFALSAFFHLIICVVSIRWTLYFWWIDGCRQPLRYAIATPPPLKISLLMMYDDARPCL